MGVGGVPELSADAGRPPVVTVSDVPYGPLPLLSREGHAV